MRVVILLGGFIAATNVMFAPGCGVEPPQTEAKPPIAELLSWRTSTDALVSKDGEYKLKAGYVFILVKVRATGDKLYVVEGSLYVQKAEDFTLSTRDGETTKSYCTRRPGSRDCNESTFVRRPPKDEEIEVVFTVNEKFAKSPDIVLQYREMPKLTLVAEKKDKGTSQ